MSKVAMIGAGSVVFCKTLMSDIMATPALEGTEFALMSRTEPKLCRMEEFGKRMLRDNGIRGSVWATLDRRDAIRNGSPAPITFDEIYATMLAAIRIAESLRSGQQESVIAMEPEATAR